MIELTEFLGSRVHIFLKTGLSAEGILNDIDDNYIILSSENNSLLFINNDKDNVSMIKIVLQENNTMVKENLDLLREPPPPELDYPEPDIKKRTEKLISIKEKRNEAFRQNIANYMKNKIQFGNKGSNYVPPDFTK